MEFKKPFRAVPIKPGKRYLAKRNSYRPPSGRASLPVVPVDTSPRSARSKKPQPRRSGSGAGILAGAALVGAVGGLGSVVLPHVDWSSVRSFAADAGLVRAREPQPGDVWSGCNAARAAGTAPIYASEPGYRPEMDGDGDGIACEPYR